MSAESAVAAVAALVERDATGRGLRVEFFRLQDRYAHRILAVGCEELPVLLLESVDGAADDHWPPSPAFQALNLEVLQDGKESAESSPAAMLVGMSGSTHWSMSVNPLTKPNSHERFGGQVGFQFDAAGRLKSPPKVLSTRYAVGKRVRVQQTGDGMMLHIGSGQYRLHSHSPDGITGPIVWQFEQRAHELRHTFMPHMSQLELPCTVRWGYFVQLTGD